MWPIASMSGPNVEKGQAEKACKEEAEGLALAPTSFLSVGEAQKAPALPCQGAVCGPLIGKASTSLPPYHLGLHVFRSRLPSHGLSTPPHPTPSSDIKAVGSGALRMSQAVHTEAIPHFTALIGFVTAVS